MGKRVNQEQPWRHPHGRLGSVAFFVVLLEHPLEGRRPFPDDRTRWRREPPGKSGPVEFKENPLAAHLDVGEPVFLLAGKRCERNPPPGVSRQSAGGLSRVNAVTTRTSRSLVTRTSREIMCESSGGTTSGCISNSLSLSIGPRPSLQSCRYSSSRSVSAPLPSSVWRLATTSASMASTVIPWGTFSSFASMSRRRLGCRPDCC